MTSWLSRQRKQALLDLSNEAGLEQKADALKDEIIESLDSYLQQNATRLSGKSTFEPYYGTRRTPFKVRGSDAGMTSDDGVKSAVKARGRRTTKVKQEFDDDLEGHASSPAGPSSSTAMAPSTTASALVRHTPATKVRRQSQLPPSPADVADLAEYETSQFYAGLNDIYTLSGFPEMIDYLRDVCSSVTGIQTFVQLLEAFALQRLVLPWVFLAELAPVRGYDAPKLSIYYPDLFALLTPEFWNPTLLYATTSIIIPSTFAYFFNLTIRDVKRHGARVSVARYTLDPLTFNIVKAILTYVIYGQHLTLSYPIFTAAGSIERAMFGGYQGMLVGCYVGMLASVYEAVQRRA